MAACLGVGGCKDRDREAEGGDKEAAGRKPPSKAIVGEKWMNVLFISVDTTRSDHLGCYGHPTVKTPNIDRFAAEGARFEQCISSAPLTLVSHSTMMTGSYQYVHGARDNTAFKLSPENVTLAEIFKDAGYYTAAEVATVILNPEFGLDQGFDHFGAVPDLPPPGMRGPVTRDEMDMAKAAELAARTDVPAQLSDRRADEVTRYGIELLRQRKPDKPFFIFLHYYDPHWPFEAPDEFMKRYDDPYFAEIAFFDQEFGRLIAELDKLGLGEKTLVILVSDHGEGKGQHGENTHSAFLYDATQHVPLIMRCKGTIPPGLVIPAQVRIVDLAETILEFVGLESAINEHMQGTSLLPFLADPSLDLRLECYGDTIVPQLMYGFSPLRSIRADGWKYILAPVPELYDLKGDPLEVFNRAQLEADRAVDMRQRLWDIIHDSPPPPGSRAGVQATDSETLARLLALGYVGTTDSLGDLAKGSELDHFEPEGVNPRSHIEEIELITASLGAVRIGRFEMAEKGLRRVLEIVPDHPVGITTLATALAGQRKFEEAEKLLRRAVEKNLKPNWCEVYRKLGVVLFHQRKLEDCEKYLMMAIECSAEDFVAYMHMASLRAVQGRIDDAIEQLGIAIKISPKSPLGYSQRGIMFSRKGEYEKAMADFDEALRLEPLMAMAHAGKALVLTQLGQTDDAIAYLTKQIESLPEEPVLQYQLGQCYVQKKDLDRAGQCLARIVELDPKSVDARLTYAANLLTRSKKDEALPLLREAVELGPDSLPAHAQLLAVLDEKADVAEMLKLHQVIVEKWPKNANFRIAAVLASEELGPARAIEILGKGVETFPNDPAIANDLAWRLATSKDAELRDGSRAVQLAERASSLAEHEDPYFLDTLAAAYAETGQFEKAVAHAERALEMAAAAGNEAIEKNIRARRDLYKKGQPYHES